VWFSSENSAGIPVLVPGRQALVGREVGLWLGVGVRVSLAGFEVAAGFCGNWLAPVPYSV